LKWIPAVNSPGRYFFALLVVLLSSSVNAEWTRVSKGDLLERQHYIDHASVKQSGPMAIYRQVHVLSQEPELRNQGIQSKFAVYEYDCMNSKLRVLETSVFSAAWAKGEKKVLQPSSPDSKQWQDLPNHALGRVTLNLLCPSGKDD
jgi:hypothetical protein